MRICRGGLYGRPLRLKYEWRYKIRAAIKAASTNANTNTKQKRRPAIRRFLFL